MRKSNSVNMESYFSRCYADLTQNRSLESLFLLQPTMFSREKGEKSGRWPLSRSSHRGKEQKYQDATVDESPVPSPTHTAVQQGVTGVTDFVIYPAASRHHFKSKRERSAFSSHRQVETGWVSSSDLINIRFQLHTGGAERKIAELNDQQTESISFCLSRLQQRFSAFKRDQSAETRIRSLFHRVPHIWVRRLSIFGFTQIILINYSCWEAFIPLCVCVCFCAHHPVCACTCACVCICVCRQFCKGEKKGGGVGVENDPGSDTYETGGLIHKHSSKAPGPGNLRGKLLTSQPWRPHCLLCMRSCDMF